MDSYLKAHSLKLNEISQQIIDGFEKATEIVKEIYHSLHGDINAETSQIIIKSLELVSLIASKKEGYEHFVHLALGKLELQGSNAITYDDTGILNEHLSLGIKDKIDNFACSIAALCDRDENEKDLSSIITLGKDYSDDFLSKQSILCNTEDLQKQALHSLDINKSQHYGAETKTFKEYTDQLLSLEEKITGLKIGNYKNEDHNETVKRITRNIKRKQFGEIFTDSKYRRRFSDIDTKMNIRLTDNKTHREQNIYTAFRAIFRNISGVERQPIEEGKNKDRQLCYLDPDDIVMMPHDIQQNQEELNELVHFLSMSRNNSFDVQVAQSICQDTNGEHRYYDLIVDIAAEVASRKPVKRRFTIRMNVVSSDAFENAMRDCHIHSLELTYTNIFPSNCSMFKGLPIYRGSYLNRKDGIDRDEQLHTEDTQGKTCPENCKKRKHGLNPTKPLSATVNKNTEMKCNKVTPRRKHTCEKNSFSHKSMTRSQTCSTRLVSTEKCRKNDLNNRQRYSTEEPTKEGRGHEIQTSCLSVGSTEKYMKEELEGGKAKRVNEPTTILRRRDNLTCSNLANSSRPCSKEDLSSRQRRSKEEQAKIAVCHDVQSRIIPAASSEKCFKNELNHCQATRVDELSRSNSLDIQVAQSFCQDPNRTVEEASRKPVKRRLSLRKEDQANIAGFHEIHIRSVTAASNETCSKNELNDQQHNRVAELTPMPRRHDNLTCRNLASSSKICSKEYLNDRQSKFKEEQAKIATGHEIHTRSLQTASNETCTKKEHHNRQPKSVQEPPTMSRHHDNNTCSYWANSTEMNAKNELNYRQPKHVREPMTMTILHDNYAYSTCTDSSNTCSKEDLHYCQRNSKEEMTNVVRGHEIHTCKFHAVSTEKYTKEELNNPRLHRIEEPTTITRLGDNITCSDLAASSETCCTEESNDCQQKAMAERKLNSDDYRTDGKYQFYYFNDLNC